VGAPVAILAAIACAPAWSDAAAATVGVVTETEDPSG
jgi:hypothetical protein